MDGEENNFKPYRIWGCPAHVLDKESTKLDSRSEVCMFVGYPRETKGGYFYNPKKNKVMLEDMSNSIVASEVPNVDIYPINEERQVKQQIPRELHHSGKP